MKRVMIWDFDCNCYFCDYMNTDKKCREFIKFCGLTVANEVDGYIYCEK